jgi:sirohydrochlorin ferrochelatase
VNGLLLVGHGSKSPTAAAETAAIGRMISRALPVDAVEVGFLEMTDPPAAAVLGSLVERGCRRVTVLPLMLLGAGHAKSDVPALVLAARERYRDLDYPIEIVLGAPLGVTRDLVATLGDRVNRSGAGGLPLLLVARGTSDPDANGDAAKVSRLVAEWTGAPFAHAAFTGVTGPRVPDGLDVFDRLGHRRMAVAFWFLCHGLLIDRARAEIDEFTSRTGVEVIDAGYIGPVPSLVPVVLDRYREALAARPAHNCDLCAYRAPWPGREDRVGQPAGTGHSHLAATHGTDHTHDHGLRP